MRALRLLALLALAAFAGLWAGCSSGPTGGNDVPVERIPPEGAVLHGQLTAAQSRAAQPIEVKSVGHGRLAVTLVLLSNLPENQLEVNVTGPSTGGDEADTAPFLYVFAGANPTISFDAPATGTWTAKVTLSSGTTANYELHWCADEQDNRGPAENKACHHVY